MPLTERQKAELNESILEYLKDNGYENALNGLCQDLGQSAESVTVNMKSLEKKWTSVLRLSKKVQDLESKLSETTKELEECKPYAFDIKSQFDKEIQDLIPVSKKFTFQGHRRAVNRVRFHPTYTWLVSCGEDASIGIWDFETGKNEKWLKGHTDSVNDANFNTNGTLLISGSSDMSLKLWNLQDEYRCIRTFNGHDHTVSGVTFTTDNLRVISCSRDGNVKIWNIDNGYCENSLRPHDGEWVKRIIVSRDNSYMATCSVDQTLMVCDQKSGKEIQVFEGHEHVVECIAFSTPRADETISRKQKENDEEFLKPWYIASGCRDRSIRIWDIITGNCVMKLNGHDNWVRGLVFHQNGKYLISCADDKTIRVWDLTKGRLHSTIQKAHGGFIQSLDWNPARCLLATCSSQNDVAVWDNENSAGMDDF